MGNRISQPSAPAGVSPGDERAHWRAEADRHAKERNSLYEKSQVLLQATTFGNEHLSLSMRQVCGHTDIVNWLACRKPTRQGVERKRSSSLTRERCALDEDLHDYACGQNTIFMSLLCTFTSLSWLRALSHQNVMRNVTKRSCCVVGTLQAADQAMRAANKKAADAAFQSNNRSGVRDSDTVDLHGLYVEEAVSRLKQRLDEAQTEVPCLSCCLPTILFWANQALLETPFLSRISILTPAHTNLS